MSSIASSAVSSPSRVIAHARWELRLLLRNGEQILLMLVIPIALLVALNLARKGAINETVPTVIAVSLMATCFTSLAIGTGFERRAGALRFLATTPLSRIELLLAKFIATTALAAMSIAAIVLVSLTMDWHPQAQVAGVIGAVILGGAACSAWAVWLAGALRAEAVLALANGIFILLMVFGGVVIPASDMPGVVGQVATFLPSAALADALRASLRDGIFPAMQVAILFAWALVAAVLARRTFKWD